VRFEPLEEILASGAIGVAVMLSTVRSNGIRDASKPMQNELGMLMRTKPTTRCRPNSKSTKSKTSLAHSGGDSA